MGLGHWLKVQLCHRKHTGSRTFISKAHALSRFHVETTQPSRVNSTNPQTFASLSQVYRRKPAKTLGVEVGSIHHAALLAGLPLR